MLKKFEAIYSNQILLKDGDIYIYNGGKLDMVGQLVKIKKHINGSVYKVSFLNPSKYGSFGCDKIYLTSLTKKQVFSDDDPYGEEEWENDINESNKNNDLKVGYTCIFNRDNNGSAVGLPQYVGHECVIVRIDAQDIFSRNNTIIYNYLIMFKNNKSAFVCSKDHLTPVDPKIIEERKRKKEELKNIDPYGEEEWEINESKIPYQKELCQDIWNDEELKEKIENKLIKIAKDFFEDVELDTDIIDIHLTGSMSNYNYNSNSDIDVHVVIDFSDVNEDTELVKKAIDGQRFIWNLRHNITIKGHDVELYIQDNSESHTSAGLYSLLNHKWIKKPTYDPPEVDVEDIDIKYNARLSDINKFEKLSEKDLEPDDAQKYYDAATELKTKIMKARKRGLIGEGEFSIENLVFKKLRSEGDIKRLIEIITSFYDKIYSQ